MVGGGCYRLALRRHGLLRHMIRHILLLLAPHFARDLQAEANRHSFWRQIASFPQSLPQSCQCLVRPWLFSSTIKHEGARSVTMEMGRLFAHHRAAREPDLLLHVDHKVTTQGREPQPPRPLHILQYAPRRCADGIPVPAKIRLRCLLDLPGGERPATANAVFRTRFRPYALGFHIQIQRS